jgi:hypothetical protein
MPEAFEVIGARKAAAHYAQIAHRAGNPAEGLKELTPELERAERELFGSYGGKYVDTGDLMASLTQEDASGALREAHGEEFTFGTDVWYAVYQGTRGPGMHQHPSAVLRMPEMVRRTAAEAAVRYIVEGDKAAVFEALA